MSKFIGDVSAYAYAVSKGYTGTEEEFAELMASYADVGQTAVDAKDAAVAANTAAQTAANTATTKASEATTAATTATTKAGEASQSASTATSAKDTAVSASQTATSKASEAAQSATSANTAKVDAVAAKTAAETAQGKAETAQEAAEAVAESIPSDYSQLSEDVSDLKENLTTKADLDELYKAFPTDTASGAVASFADGANVPVKSLIVNIDPVQEGSGDPSPDNVRPISGWSEVNVNVSGKNLFDSNFADYTKPYNYYICPIKLENGKRYKLKAELVGTTITGVTFGLVKSGNRYEEFVGTFFVIGSNGDAREFSITVNDTFTAPKLVAYVSGENQFNEALSNYNVMLMPYEQADYEPYSGENINIQLGQTAYGGTLDVLSGELVIDRAMRTLTGADDWILDSDGTSRDGVTCLRAYQEMSALKKPVGNEGNRTYIGVIIASNLPTVKNGYVNQLNMDGIDIAITGYAGDKGNYLYIIINKSTMSIRTVADLKAWLAENNVQFCYELATPLTVTLTSNELSTLLGANNIWSDAGEVTAEYRADTTLFIQRKIAEALS